MPSALEFIHAAAQRAGRYDRRVTTSDGTTSTLVCSAFANSVLDSSEFANFAILIEDGACAGQMGMLTNAGLTKASGTLTTATQFSSSVASGTTFSMYSRDRLPPVRLASKPGWLELLNEALPLTWFEDTLWIDGVNDAYDYVVDTTVWPWFTDDTRIVEILAPTTAPTDIPTVMGRASWSWVSDGETRKLRFPGRPFRTGQTFGVKVNRPGNSRLKLNASLRANLTSTAVSSVTVVAGGHYTALPTITASGGATFTAVMAATPGPITSVTVNAGGTYTAGFPPALTVTRHASDIGWADQATQTAGLVTMSDESIPDVRLVRPTLLALGFKALAELGAPGQTQEEWLGKAAEWEQVAVSLKAARTPRDATAGVPRLRSVAMRSGPFGRCR